MQKVVLSATQLPRDKAIEHLTQVLLPDARQLFKESNGDGAIGATCYRLNGQNGNYHCTLESETCEPNDAGKLIVEIVTANGETGASKTTELNDSNKRRASRENA